VPQLVELEARLAADHDGSLRARLQEELSQARSLLQARLARGATQVQYRRWAASERALGAALTVLAKVRVEAPQARVEGPAAGFKPDVPNSNQT
jgi:type III secretion system YseE family protein